VMWLLPFIFLQTCIDFMVSAESSPRLH